MEASEVFLRRGRGFGGRHMLVYPPRLIHQCLEVREAVACRCTKSQGKAVEEAL